jgi:hypothetical protein
VQHQSIAVDQQVQLVGVVVDVTIEPDVEIADNVNRLLEDGDSVEDYGQLIEELILRHGGRTWPVDDDRGGGELTDNSSDTQHLECGRPIDIDERRQRNIGGGDDGDTAVVDR